MSDVPPTAYRVPVTYNLQVTRELLKQVYVTERLQIPHWTTFVSEYSSLWSRARNQAFLRELIRSGGWMKVGVYAVEGYGIFKVGLLTFLTRTNGTLIYLKDWRDDRAQESRRLQRPVNRPATRAAHDP
jgi:hypothetical protein